MDENESTTRVRIVINGETFSATLEDSAATRDFIEMLPLELTLEDYANTEKVSDLPASLSTEGAPEGMKPSVGDITYYAPWGNLAIFYREFRHSKGLVKLGRLEGAEKLSSMDGPLPARIELE